MDEIELKVAEAMQIDYGKRIVRLDSNARRVLALTTGDVVEIKAKKSTAALVLPAHPQDEGLNIVRMDGILRQNTGVGLGDRVRLRKAEIRNAKKIVLAPNQASRYAPGFDAYVKKNLIGKPLSKGDILSVNIFGTSFPFVVAQTVPAGLVLVSNETELTLKDEPVKDMGKIATISYEDIGGLKDEVQKIREMVELPMRHPELFERLGIEPPKGVLIYGTPGTGKTLLARAVASESEAHFITINGPEIISKFVGEAEERLRQ
ncbi:MAG TPA: AAA family ATPase, partial [Candidatus Norongarragalinales archaeon]|nr:AAA family ATPase [Candidatus Norongarragalinales archaeon]